jgi:hypothetical protein
LVLLQAPHGWKNVEKLFFCSTGSNNQKILIEKGLILFVVNRMGLKDETALSIGMISLAIGFF